MLRSKERFAGTYSPYVCMLIDRHIHRCASTYKTVNMWQVQELSVKMNETEPNCLIKWRSRMFVELQYTRRLGRNEKNGRCAGSDETTPTLAIGHSSKEVEPLVVDTT